MNMLSWKWSQVRVFHYVVGLLVLMMVLLFPGVIYAEEGVEEGDIIQHQQFEFEAYINHSDIIDGAAPFDANDDAGNDSDPKNNIVRSWDNITYPIKITINPKNTDMLENIKLRFSGTLENGAVDNRINAKFSVGGKEDVKNDLVSFTQEYIVEQTGNSIMVPISIDVQGAKHGIELRPDISVEVVSVDGKAISGVKTDFDELPAVTTSAKVNIKPLIGTGLAGQGLDYYPYSGITKNLDDFENVHAFGIAWTVEPLANKTDIRGSTFPDPNGKINYEVTLSGSVAWDSPARTEQLDFTGRDTPFLLLDQRPISTVRRAVGAKNTLLDGISYTYDRTNRYNTPLSFLASPSQAHHSVYDSGDWEVEPPQINKHAVKYDGHNTNYVIGSSFPRHRSDGYTGGYLYGENTKVFSTNGFMVLMPNEYRIGGKNNPDGKGNNVNYRASLKLLSYTDENGHTENFEKQQTVAMSFVERNNSNGSIRFNTTLFGESNQTLGTPIIGNNGLAKGDASTIIGSNVTFYTSFGHTAPIPGGYTNVFRWNTDAFELTKDRAKRAEDQIYQVGYRNRFMEFVRNDKENQKVYYGVPKFDKSDNKFETFTKKGRYDYDWYDTYDEAIKQGVVGAMMSDYRVYSITSSQAVRIPLRVKHENIGLGSFSKDGSANIVTSNSYVYYDESRSKETDITRNRPYHNPAMWDNEGVLDKVQSPSRGGNVNFETLAITSAQTSTALTSDKTTYYNSETVNWTAKNSIVLPTSGIPDDLDSGITVKHTLPKGLDYKVGSGKIGGVGTDPEVEEHSNGTKTLIWSTFVSNNNYTIPNITFQTSINPFALSANSVSSGLTVTSEIVSELDGRPLAVRSNTQNITVLKVGMVGIYESINKTYGEKNSDYKVTLSPYTTIEDEAGVTGLTHLPLSGDPIGSNYQGLAKITDITLHANRVHDDPVEIYLNRAPIYDDMPQQIDTSTGGWYLYTGEASELDGASSLLFHVDGLMTNQDNIRIEVEIQTENNAFGDEYMNETVINSATNYRLSPISNRVRYMIRADLELALDRFQIYTNKASSGLPTSTRVSQTVLDEDSVKNENITLAIYDRDMNRKVVEKTYKQSDLARENTLTIPGDTLEKGDKRNYEVRIENFNEDKIWVRDGEGVVDTDGYTASQETLTIDDLKTDDSLQFKGVVKTERVRGGDIALFHETITLDPMEQPTVTSGYGYSFTPKLTYQNDILSDVGGRIDGVNFSPSMELLVDHRILDETLSYYEEAVPFNADEKVTIALHPTETPGTNEIGTAYKLPPIFLEQGSGNSYTQVQRDAGISDNLLVDAGNQLFVPVWIADVGSYDVALQTTEPMGAHFIGIDLMNQVNVNGFMFSSVDSETTAHDAIIIRPMAQSDIPETWHEE